LSRCHLKSLVLGGGLKRRRAASLGPISRPEGNTRALPLTLIYDRTGKLQKMLEESVTFDSLMALVKPLL
jgi:hypothetical protein